MDYLSNLWMSQSEATMEAGSKAVPVYPDIWQFSVVTPDRLQWPW